MTFVYKNTPLRIIIICLLLQFAPALPVAQAQDLGLEQANEKLELEKMKSEIGDIKSNINDAVSSMSELAGQISGQNIKEFHLFARQARIQIAPGIFANCLTYNGKLPGPTIRVQEGTPVKIVLHNQLNVPTSLIISGLILPAAVSALPRQAGGLVRPGETFAYQFIPKQSGTFWYHPQVNHGLQIAHGMYGALIVEPKMSSISARDFVFIFGKMSASPLANEKASSASSHVGGRNDPALSGTNGGAKFYIVNGATGAATAPIELNNGERIRFRLINASDSVIPLALSGHKFAVLAINGSDSMEPHVFRDIVTLNPADRVDVEFLADNPGVWSFASQIPEQASDAGKFPGGIACVVRYADAEAHQ